MERKLTIEDLKKKHSSRPHNPILASAFFKGGLIEAWGRGTLKIINECKKAGLPEPKIERTSGGISVTILKEMSVSGEVTPPVTTVATTVATTVTTTVEKVILVLDNELKREKIQKLLKLKNKNNFIKNYLQPAITLGLIEMTIPDKPNSRFQKYRLTEKGKKLKRKLKKENR